MTSSSSFGSESRKRPRKALWLALAAWLGAAVLAAFLTGEVARRGAEAELSRQAQSAAALHAAVLRSELEKHRSLPLALSGDPDIASLLISRADAADPVNAKLEGLARQTRAAVIYVIDAGGRTRAASNWRLPTSFVGADYGFRPYFINAMRSGQAEFFALGTVSGRPGLYLARRVDAADGRPLGVVVVKVEFDALEAEWRASGEPAYVVDPTGVVLITSVPDWRFRTLDPLDEMRRRLTLTGQTLRPEALSPLPFDTPPDDRPRLVRTSPIGGEQRWMHAAVATDTPGWTLHLLSPSRGAVEAAVASARALAALIVTLLAGLAAFLLRRRHQALIRARAEEDARHELERRIDERTRELSDANVAPQRPDRGTSARRGGARTAARRTGAGQQTGRSGPDRGQRGPRDQPARRRYPDPGRNRNRPAGSSGRRNGAHRPVAHRRFDPADRVDHRKPAHLLAQDRPQDRRGAVGGTPSTAPCC